MLHLKFTEQDFEKLKQIPDLCTSTANLVMQIYALHNELEIICKHAGIDPPEVIYRKDNHRG